MPKSNMNIRIAKQHCDYNNVPLSASLLTPFYGMVRNYTDNVGSLLYIKAPFGAALTSS